MGGAEKIVVMLTQKLIERGHQVDICTFKGDNIAVTPSKLPEGEGLYTPKIFKLGHGYYNPIYILKLMKLMKDYDIVHTHNSSPQLFAAIANIFCGKKLITTEHNTDNRKRGNALLSSIDKWMYRRYQKVVCISDIAEDLLRKYLNDASDKISTINNGVDVEAIHSATPLENKPEKKFIALMVAAFRPQKDQDTLVRAISKLDDSYEVWFAGADERVEAVKALAEKLGVSDRVKFLGLRKDVPHLLRTADVVVMSSHYEGLSLSNIEGMSADKPFVASDVNGLREVTKGYGILFPHQDADALAAIIKKLHDDKDYYQEVAEKCYQRAEQFDVSIMIDSYEKAYKTL